MLKIGCKVDCFLYIGILRSWFKSYNTQCLLNHDITHAKTSIFKHIQYRMIYLHKNCLRSRNVTHKNKCIQGWIIHYFLC